MNGEYWLMMNGDEWCMMMNGDEIMVMMMVVMII